MLKGKTGFNVKYVLVVTTLSTQNSQIQLIEKYYKVDVLCEIQNRNVAMNVHCIYVLYTLA